MSKEERAKIAIQKRAQEIREQREKEDRQRQDRDALEREAEALREKERRDESARYGRPGRCKFIHYSLLFNIKRYLIVKTL